ncbi:MAG: PfkB family carbohydrate kinase [Pseudomonadota bacterium]|nr:PfkB family carbohydrate kinase [Pseudomonadota bacterium]
MVEPGRRAAVIGEALIDRFPEADVIGGAPFNVARNLALLGASPLMVTRIGADALGATIEADFARYGMDTRGLQRDPDHATGTVTVHMQGTQHRFEIGTDAAWDHLDGEQAAAEIGRIAPAVTYFGTLAQRSPVAREAVRAGLAASAAVPFLDLNLRDGPDNRTLAHDSLFRARLVKVNDDELHSLIDWFVHPGIGRLPWGVAAHRAAAEALVRHFELDRLTVTRGAAGWACVDAEGRWLEGAAPPVTVRDTVGAGDAFASVLVLGELRGWPLLDTLQRAGVFASAVCGIDGAVDPNSAIYARARHEWSLDSSHAA